MATKIEQLGLHGKVWAVSFGYAELAAEQLSRLDQVECAKEQAKFDAAQKAQSAERAKPYRVDGRTAIIEVRGPMTKRQTSASWLFGGTACVRVQQELAFAKSDPDVDQVLMVFETPGGSVNGLPELADAVKALDAVKPVHAFCEDGCYSAGYYVASQCRSISVNPTGWVGCLGSVIAPVIDASRAADREGVTVHVVSTGAYKGMLTRGAPVTAEHLAHLQDIVDFHGRDFFDRVLSGRNMGAETLEPLFDGREFSAAQALDLGLVDCVCSYEACLETISAGLTPGWDAGEPGEIGDNSNMSTESPNLVQLVGNAVTSALVKAGLVKDQSAGGPALATAPPEAGSTVEDLSPVLAETNAKLAEASKRLEEMTAKARADLVASKLKACEDKFEPAAFDAVEAAYTLAAKHGDEMVAAVDALVGTVSASPLTAPVIPDDAKAVDGDTKTPKTTSAKRKRELIAAAGVTPQETK